MAVQSPETHRSFVEEARRQQIVEAAIEAMAELGYRRTSFARIAERVRISPSLISYHFHSKVELNRAIALAIQQDLEGSMAAATNQAISHLDAVRRLIVAFVEYVDGHRDRMEALRQMGVALAPDERAGIGALDEQDGIRRWQELLTAGQAARELRAFDTHSVAVAIMGLLNAVPRELIRNANADAGHLGNELAALVTAGIANIESPGSHGRTRL